MKESVVLPIAQKQLPLSYVYKPGPSFFLFEVCPHPPTTRLASITRPAP